jgi:hypothetical protein
LTGVCEQFQCFLFYGAGPLQNARALLVSALSKVEIFTWVATYQVFILLRRRKFVKAVPLTFWGAQDATSKSRPRGMRIRR